MLLHLLQSVHPPSFLFGLVVLLLWALKVLDVVVKAPKWRMAVTRIRDTYLRHKYLINGAVLIEKSYATAKGIPFVIHTPGRSNTMVTTDFHIRELDKAPRSVLSLHAVAKEFLQPKHTMHGFEWKDQRGIEGTGFVRAIRELLTSRLPQLVPKLSLTISKTLNAEKSNAKVSGGWHRLSLFSTAKHIVTAVNCAVFFPPELAENREFLRAALDFPEDVFLASEIIQLLPHCIAGALAKLATRNHRSATAFYDFLYPVVQRRMKEHSDSSALGEQHDDGIQWLIQTTPKRETWSTERLVGEIMAVWYGSLHTLAIASTNALIDLYSHPEYIQPLRAEVESTQYDAFKRSSEGLPELDSFLKESARLSAFESTGIRRQALDDFRFSDGLLIPKGSWVCVPHRAMMRDEKHFPHARHFDGRRFLKPEDKGLSHHSDSWLVWGAGRIVCPGRFYATVVLKLVISLFLTEYDCELEPINGFTYVQWRTALIPKSSITLRIKSRT
ncbi:cytochrome P450 [Lophiotrema nucula]|uniref:Cytochrome P450 n=1 Tax=Lophiotrema nucula TaxID=690887 RepID=A0A6A5ZRB7_9PLEO|nr:cytochrome P450 [Lophiotrema nucula]